MLKTQFRASWAIAKYEMILRMAYKLDTITYVRHLPLASLTRVLQQEPGRIEYYNQLFSLPGHLGGVSEIQTSLDVSDL